MEDVEVGKQLLQIKAYFDCHIFHMDDFYLQKYQRTQERYNEPGGNVDRERFKKEVGPNN